MNLLGEGEQTNIVLGIGSDLCLAHQVDAVLLHIHTGREVITISLVITVVETERRKVRIYINQNNPLGVLVSSGYTK